MRLPIPDGVKGDAEISLCGRFRWWLRRVWDASLPTMCFVMLNPSDAAANVDDPTVRACCVFARTSGCGGVVIVNLYAWRSPYPAELVAAGYPVGDDNDSHIRGHAAATIAGGGVVVCAWGADAPRDRVLQVAQVLVGIPLSVLRLTRDGSPSHPLARGKGFIPRSTRPQLWRIT